ncbi:hypothetical protein FALCPG4_009124 [Fusarium falciforme]
MEQQGEDVSLLVSEELLCSAFFQVQYSTHGWTSWYWPALAEVEHFANTVKVQGRSDTALVLLFFDRRVYQAFLERGGKYASVCSTLKEVPLPVINGDCAGYEATN